MMDNPFATVRHCLWPGCVSTYLLATGPTAPGWTRLSEVGRDAALCPFHADAGHRPEWTARSPAMIPRCSCGATGQPVLTLRGVREAWAVHIVSTDGSGG